MALIDTRINYFTPPTDGSKPYKWIDEVDAPRLNWTPIEFDVQVKNVRGHESDFTLDKAGFEFHNAIRRPRPAGTPDTPENRTPVKMAHVDQTPESAKRHVHMHPRNRRPRALVKTIPDHQPLATDWSPGMAASTRIV
ncbi:hypothetical protein CTheo_4954 [Ceratobasidium theobromae]|uniref:Uncharacterized protein n=1 Tax=Ceratobasidium theobromae TaxID=1582974 RepID=A0A5N5QJH1_9AGAM|nr:hypothetical protein CTheo_4954 [Ceratobasidium theobromae]